MCRKAIADEQLIFGPLQPPDSIEINEMTALCSERIERFPATCQGPDEMPPEKSGIMQLLQAFVGAIDSANVADDLDLLAIQDFRGNKFTEQM
jgi:hypothetical protein